MSSISDAKPKQSAGINLPKSVKIWLIIGLVMILIQIFLGGVTRLTGSGLSITRWQIVTGALPPLSESQWAAEFDLYKQTPQFLKLNTGMSMSDFKFIYFWEYFHRLWARLMFFVFIIPFFWFLAKKQFSKVMVTRLIVVVLLAALEGFFGWIMVASGLISRPWVNAYNLTLHLSMALVIYSYLIWTTFIAVFPDSPILTSNKLRRSAFFAVALAGFQIVLGALMSGTKAGLHYPTWPDMSGYFIPPVLSNGENWQWQHLIEYDTHAFMPALVQFIHRNTAYLLSALLIWLFIQTKPFFANKQLKTASILLIIFLAIQVLLGILTLLHCMTGIPVVLGVMHQTGAVLLLSALLYYTYLVFGSEKSR